jgi:REP element-mobilizing transposase RayT
MARRARIEVVGKHHVVNRGVAQMRIFEELMCFYAKSFGIVIHNYCLMYNHYHLLLEIQSENLSKFMRQLNMNYSSYSTKKNKCTGYLWQGRFKSCTQILIKSRNHYLTCYNIFTKPKSYCIFWDKNRTKDTPCKS